MHTSLLTATLAAAFTAPVAAQQWLDDFLDGSAIDGVPVMWVPSPAFGGEFTVTDGDMVITIPAGASPAISSPRVPINFPAGASVRARMVAFNGPGRFTVAFADEPTGIKGYVASFSTCSGGRIELFRGDVAGSIVFLGVVPWPHYSPLDEHIIQLDVFDGVVSARVWRPGEPFPEPQVSAVDTRYASGVASIAIQDFGSGNCTGSGDFTDAGEIVRYAQASATPLTHSGAGDVNADGRRDFEDLLIVLAEWGPCPGGCPPSCPADVAPAGGDCMVGVPDLLAVIANWG